MSKECEKFVSSTLLTRDWGVSAGGGLSAEARR